MFNVGAEKLTLKKDGPDITRLVSHPSQFWAMVDLARAQKPGSFQSCPINMFDLTKTNMSSYVLNRMVEIAELKPDVGGFADVTEPMLAALGCGTYQPGTPPDERYLGYLSLHPFLEQQGHFCFGLAVPEKMMQLLNYIYDIRRFRDVDGNSNIVSEFNLSQPNHLFRVFRNNRVDKPSLRSAMAFNAWQIVDLKDVDNEFVKRRPGAWLHREYLAERERLRSTVGHEKCDWFAKYHVTVRFLQYIEKLWTAGIGLDTFDPNTFFTSDAEKEVYREVIK